MKILSIETSCDETAISIIEAKGNLKNPSFSILGNSLFSQIDLHREYGGVFPNLAKREHSKNLTPLLIQSLKEADMFSECQNDFEDKWQEIENILKKENNLYEDFRKDLIDVCIPEIDVISVTSGPGLEPALWVGISFAKALAKLWNKPVVGVNHMEGHLCSILIEAEQDSKNKNVEFPAIALLISGGHTELVKISDWGKYQILGQTKDDAVGEAFDKVARLLGLPYPGGPEISKLAEEAEIKNISQKAIFPRPMIHSKDLNFSFSGLKTAVLYYIKNLKKDLLDEDKMDIAREFENSVVDVLLNKTREAIEIHNAKTLIIAGGVVSNKKIRETFKQFSEENNISIFLPDKKMSTDNSLMIAIATYINILINQNILNSQQEIVADGNMRL